MEQDEERKKAFQEQRQLAINNLDEGALDERFDDMTYEELLMLGDKIGIVSKGLTADLISDLPMFPCTPEQAKKCIK